MESKTVAAFIIFTNHPILKDKVPLFEGENLIGRVPEKASVIIKDAQISSLHAKIKITSTAITVTDMGSKNGTFLDLDNRERTEKGKEYPIAEKQLLSFGEVEFHLERVPQPKKTKESPRNQKVVPEKKLSDPIDFEDYPGKDSKKSKAKNQDVSLDEKQADKKGKKNLEKEKEKQKEKQKQLKEKQLKEKKLKEQKEKERKEKQEQAKKEREEEQRREREQKERQEREEEQRREKQEKLKQEKELKKKQEQKKKELEKKKDEAKNLNKNEQKGGSKNDQKDKQSEKNESKNAEKIKNDQKATKKGKADTKEASKGAVEKEKPNADKGLLNPKNIKARKSKSPSNQKKSKSKSKSKEKSQVSSSETSRSSSVDSKQVKASKKTVTRKRVPEQNNDDRDSDELKGYRLRKRMLRVVKFKISGNPITFHTSPLMSLAEDHDDDYDVLVMDGYMRTYKLLYAVARGIPVVKKSWLIDSVYNKKVAEVDYYWLEYPENKWAIKNSVKKVQEGNKLLDGMEFYIATHPDNLHLDFKKLQKLIYVCGGAVVMFSANLKNKNLIVLVERHDEDEAEIKKAKSVNKDRIYDLELVLEGIIIGELDFEKHKIDS